ncbi:hypothetical protein FJT64_014358 [Amphibalanus amphitrite]|uniref:Uncharacterized protein n=1 Tax=Amphibalanus amphitrite TaxID=1232801 RepID=A0A6A4VA30_AMPAM|nr:hypothetical protein FJT64_014358 [Amphibalanus amphitrite]
MDVVSLPSSGSEGHHRDSSEENWSMVDERPGSGAASPPRAAAAADSQTTLKDASPPSESSEPITVTEEPVDATAGEGWGWSTGEEEADEQDGYRPAVRRRPSRLCRETERQAESQQAATAAAVALAEQTLAELRVASDTVRGLEEQMDGG